MRNLNRANGVALILMVFLMLASSLVALVAFSLFAEGLNSSGSLSESIQAFAIAVGGRQWYLEQLANDNDWTDELERSNIALGSGTFDIIVNTKSSNSVSFTITGKVSGFLGQTVQRQVRSTAKKLPKACLFSVFWQGDGQNSELDVRGNTHIRGNFWSAGSALIRSGSDVTGGLVYYAEGEGIRGAGIYATQVVKGSPPAMPLLDTAYYENLMAGYDSKIDANISTLDEEWRDETIDLNGGIIYQFRNLETRGDVIITGHGKIIVKKDIILNARNERGSLNILPSGGIIEILAGGNFMISNNRAEQTVNISSSTIMYARNASLTYNEIFGIDRGKKLSNVTSIIDALILARRRLIVRKGASITDSTLYLDYANPSNNNLLQITDSGTQIINGIVISRGRRAPSLQINSGASVTGLVYQYANSNEGWAEIDGGSIIQGALLVRQFYNDRFGPATVTHSLNDILSALPEGIDGYVLTEPSSWDDN